MKPRRHTKLDYHHRGHTRYRPTLRWILLTKKPRPTRPAIAIHALLSAAPRHPLVISKDRYGR